MLTEEEAKTRWCPHVRADRRGAVVNRDSDGEVLEQHCCIGSACMAWRWGDAPVKIVSSGRVSLPIRTGEPPTHGYCGLAGKAGAP